MKEKDIRERIHMFLRDTVRQVVVPASMGIGLALVGCNDTALNANQDGSADSSSVQTGSGGSTGTNSSATGGMVALYMAPMGGASGGVTGTGGAAGTAGAMATGGLVATGGVIETGGVRTGGVPVYMAGMPEGGATGAGGVTATGGVMKYMAPQPDAATGTGGMPGTGGMTAVPLYMGSFPLPDAASADAKLQGMGGMIALYMGPQPAYMAVLPPELRRDGGIGTVTLYAAPVPTRD